MIRLFHVSDLHFGAEDKGAIAWFADTVRAERPDAVLMTGDLTMRARAREFAAATDYLASLGVPLSVEVGNHDLPYFNPLERLFDPYRRYRLLARAVADDLVLPGITMVSVKTTARAQWRTNWSKGRVGKQSLERAVATLGAAPADHLRLVTCHHPLVEADTQATASTTGGEAAMAALAAAGADAVLSGHVHDPFDLVRPAGPGASLRVIGAGTLSERVRATRPSFNELSVTGRDLKVVVREMPGVPGKVHAQGAPVAVG